VNRFKSNHDQSDHWPILHISLYTFNQWKCFVSVIICNQEGHMSL